MYWNYSEDIVGQRPNSSIDSEAKSMICFYFPTSLLAYDARPLVNASDATSADILHVMGRGHVSASQLSVGDDRLHGPNKPGVDLDTARARACLLVACEL